MPGNAIKNFFKRKRDEAKFLTAGLGRKLNASSEDGAKASSSAKARPPSDAYVPPKRSELSPEAKAAADAALARMQRRGDPSHFNTSLAAIRMQVKRELEAEKQAKQAEASLAERRDSGAAAAAAAEAVQKNSNMAVKGVFFRCPMVSDEVLPRSEWKGRIKAFLYEQLESEPGLTACLIIHNCNVREKAEQCVETLAKYIENIVTHADVEKFRKIRMSNAIFTERVRSVEGGYEFLLGAGFVERDIDADTFLVHDGTNVDALPELLDALRSAEKIHLELDRNLQVLLPSQARKFELPGDFFRISPEEVKKEQRLRAEAMESAQLLKTKAMREKDVLRTLNMYNFTLVRVRFPDGVFLQGTFGVYEPLSSVVEFVGDCLKDETFEFSLAIPAGPKLSCDDHEKSLHDLRLVPSALLTFVHDQPNEMGNYLKDEYLLLIQDM